MEVHTHAPAEGKRLKHYLFEFFMLFLAVFCGFLAENYREHMIEHQREKQFVRSLFNDVVADTVRLNNLVSIRNQREILLDSLVLIINSAARQNFSVNDIYYYAAFVPRSISLRFIPNDGTIQQLKNAGGLRLIGKTDVRDSIIRYDIGGRNLIRVNEVEETLINDYRNIAHYFFDGMVFNSMFDVANMPHRPIKAPPLFPFSVDQLREFNFKLFSIMAYNRASRREAIRLLQQAKNLLELIEKEYHLQ
jgi:hypothetical protein